MLEGERSGTTGSAGAELADAVHRLRRELAAYRPVLPDRAVAEAKLDVLRSEAERAQEALGLVDYERVRHCLLMVTAVIGSVSALAEPFDALREATERLTP